MPHISEWARVDPNLTSLLHIKSGGGCSSTIDCAVSCLSLSLSCSHSRQRLEKLIWESLASAKSSHVFLSTWTPSPTTHQTWIFWNFELNASKWHWFAATTVPKNECTSDGRPDDCIECCPLSTLSTTGERTISLRLPSFFTGYFRTTLILLVSFLSLEKMIICWGLFHFRTFLRHNSTIISNHIGQKYCKESVCVSNSPQYTIHLYAIYNLYRCHYSRKELEDITRDCIFPVPCCLPNLALWWVVRTAGYLRIWMNPPCAVVTYVDW